MADFSGYLGKFVGRFRWRIIGGTLLLVLLSAAGMGNYVFTNDYRVFFSEQNPQLLALENLEQTYSKDDNILFLLVPRDGEVFSRETLAAVEALTDEAWQIPYSNRVDSLSNFQHTEAVGDDLIVRDLVDDASSLSVSERERIRVIALNEPLLLGRLLPEKADVTAVNVTIQLPGVNDAQEVQAVVAGARAITDAIEQRFPSIEIKTTGIVAMNHAFSLAAQRDMAVLVPISFVVMLGMLWLLSGTLLGTLATLLVILLSIAVGLGLGGYAGFPLTPASASAPTVILTVAIASSVHILVNYYHELNQGRSREIAVAETLRINLSPVFLTSLTTAIGFFSLNFSEVPPFRHLGNIVGFGVIACFFLVVLLLPALMTLLPARVARRGDFGHRMMGVLGGFVVHRHRQLLLGMGGFILLLVVFVPRNELNDVFVHYFDESIEFRRDADFVDIHLGGLYRIDYSLETGTGNGIVDPAFLHILDAFSAWLRTQPEVVHVAALSDIFKRLNKNLHGDEPAWYRLPDGRELAAQLLLLYEMSLPYGLDLNNQIDVDKSKTRVMVSMPVISTNAALDLDRRAQAWLRDQAPHLTTPGSSPTVMFAHIGARNIKGMLWGTSLALVLISLILVVALGSLKIGLLSMIPNLAPAAMGFGIWGLMVGEVGLSLSVVTGMTLGIVVDDTVHFLSKYLRARREQGLAAEDAVRLAFSQVGMALLITTLVLIAGFSTLALSAFYLNASMGLLTAIILALALLADFLFLPALLIKIEGI